MKKLLFIPFLFISILSISQIEVIPIKDGLTKESISKDSIFSKFLNQKGIQLSNYKICSVSEIVDYRDSLIKNKISYIVQNIKITYSNLENFNIETYRTHQLYGNRVSYRHRLLMIERTLIPDNKNEHTVRIFILE